jgi:hydroxymethylbilane synthase
MNQTLKIGTRESQLAVWQATLVQQQLQQQGINSEIVFIKSDGDIDLVTPLYELGVQGIFTKTLDAALLSGRIDSAVHSLKDVPIQLARGISQAAVLKRASYKDVLVFKDDHKIRELSGLVNNTMSIVHELPEQFSPLTIATSSIRRKAQWLNRYPGHQIENLRGNVNTRLRKVAESSLDGAIFAAAGLERIGLRPATSIELDWMLPAPAQGAIMVVCREEDSRAKQATASLNDFDTAFCTKIERDFLKALLGGCSTPISALAAIENNMVHFQGNILTPDGTDKADIDITVPVGDSNHLGTKAAENLLENGGDKIITVIRNA